MTFSKSRYFDLLFRRHRHELVAFAGQYSGDDMAEDLVQEAYLRFIQHADAGADIENPRAYLYTITRNLSADYSRYGKIRARHAADGSEVETAADPQPGPEAATEAQLKWQRCLSALDRLPAVYRHVLLLHRFDGLTYAEIGKALNLPTRTVERYAAKALAQCFAEAGSSLQE